MALCGVTMVAQGYLGQPMARNAPLSAKGPRAVACFPQGTAGLHIEFAGAMALPRARGGCISCHVMLRGRLSATWHSGNATIFMSAAWGVQTTVTEHA